MRKVFGWLAIFCGVGVLLVAAGDAHLYWEYLSTTNSRVTLPFIASNPDILMGPAVRLFVAAILFANGVLVIRGPRD